VEEYQRHTDSVFFLVKYYKKHACPAVIVRIEQSKESVRRKTRKNCQKRRTTENAIIYCFFSLEYYFQPVSLDYRSTEYQQYRSLNTIEEEDETCDDKMATTERYKNSTSSTGSGISGQNLFEPKEKTFL